VKKGHTNPHFRKRNQNHQISLRKRPYCAPWKAGKQVDDEDLRELMKENGIERPSTRAILLKHFRRQYIIRNKNRCYNDNGDSAIDTTSKTI
jgi:reverse gyrase